MQGAKRTRIFVAVWGGRVEYLVCPFTTTVIDWKSIFKNQKLECDLKSHRCDPRKWHSPPQLQSLTSVDDQFCLYYLWVLGYSCCPRPLLSSLDPLVVPHTEVMMTSSIKKSFNSDFLYLTYPSSEKSCHSNELASQRGWKKGGIGEGIKDGGGESFQKLSLWKEETGAGRGGVQSRLFLNWKAKPFGPLLFLSEQLCPWTTLPKAWIAWAIHSVCISSVLKSASKCSQSHAEKGGPFPQNLLPPFTKLSPWQSVSPLKWCHSGRDPGGKRKENSQWFGVEVEFDTQATTLVRGGRSSVTTVFGPVMKKGPVHWGSRWHFRSSHPWGWRKGIPIMTVPSELKEREN